MSVTYTPRAMKALDERWSTESKTEVAVNNSDVRIEYVGTNSAVVYHTEVVAETNYVRSGKDRFGPLVELGNGVQTLTLDQDKAFTFSVDRGNLEDSEHSLDVAKAVKRQVREVSIPTSDIFRLGVWAAYAIANSQGDISQTASSNSTAYANFLEQQAALDDAEVPPEGRITFVTPTFYNLLKRDPEFVRDCDTSYKDLKKGIIGDVDGNTIVKIPSSYGVSKLEFLTIHKDVSLAPRKFNSVRVLDDVQGIDGSVAEGRRYEGCFVLSQKGEGIRIRTHS